LIGNNDGSSIWDGSFSNTTIPSSGTFPDKIISGDVNGDENADLITVNWGSDDISVYFGKGDGTFDHNEDYAAGSDPSNVILNDFNQDGRVDLITANRNSSDISFYAGDETGSGSFTLVENFPLSERPRDLIIDDLNGDGIKDLAVSDPGNNNIRISLGDSDGRFISSLVYSAAGVSSIIAEDLNGDDILDLASSDKSYKQNILIFPGNSTAPGSGDGTFGPRLEFSSSMDAEKISTGDFNNDNIPDLVTANDYQNHISIYLGDSIGGYTLFSMHPVGERAVGITTGDFNNDNIFDVATANEGTSDVTVLLGNIDSGSGLWDGTFDTSSYTTGSGSRSVINTDLNNDGIDDLVTANYDDNNISILMGQTDGLGNAKGTFSSSMQVGVGNGCFFVQPGDFNEDGIVDLAVANSLDDNISVLIGIGNGSGAGTGNFAPAVNYTAGYGASEITTGDFNNDNITDLAVSNQLDDSFSVLLGNGDEFGTGDGTFSRQLAFGTLERPLGITSGDFNDDGFTDIAIVNLYSDTITVYNNFGLDQSSNGNSSDLRENASNVEEWESYNY